MNVLDNPLVTVIIPCYNHAHFLGEAIESVLDQTYRRFEIIVVDDGSQDNTREVVSGYPEVRYIHQENRGLASARNAGIRESKGSYLVFLDADDRLLPDALKAGVDSLNTHSECALVYGYCQYISTDGSPLPTSQLPLVDENHYLAMLRKNLISNPATAIYRRSVFDQIGGFNNNLSPAADYELYLRISRTFSIYCHRKMVAEYRLHGANMSADPELMLVSTLEALRSQRKYIDGDKRYKEAYLTGIRGWQDYYGGQLVNEIRAAIRDRRQWKQVLKKLTVVLRYYPRGFMEHTFRKLRCMIFGTKDPPL